MAILLLIIIYLAFISLGLPDTIIGVTIPALQTDFGITLANGGLLSMVVIVGTVVSSFLSEKVIVRFGTGKIVFLSCLMTGISLMGFAWSSNYYSLLLLAFPLGLGGGTVDVALNNYVAQHFKARHMNWLHSFWGVGATFGPIIMAWNLKNNTWRSGFTTISILQLSLALLLLLSLPVWSIHKAAVSKTAKVLVRSNVFRIPGVSLALFIALVYCAAEIGIGLWGSSYLISVRGLDVDTAAQYVALYYLGITIGRFISGFISFKLSNSQMIRLGILCALLGSALLLLPIPPLFLGFAIVIIGLGFAPIFPAMLHETPVRFGKELSQKVISYQMGFAYIGSAVVPPLLGLLYQTVDLKMFPITFLFLIGVLLVTTERLNTVIRKQFIK